MSAPQITVTFDPFTLDDNQEVIVQKSEAFVSNLTPWSTETNTLATWMNNQVSTVVGVGTGFVGNWSDQTGSAAKPFSVVHNNRIWTLLNNIADVTASEPGVSADWFAVTVDSTLMKIENDTNGSVFIGYNVGQYDDGSNRNTGIGYDSLSQNTSGSGLTAVGFNSLKNNTIGQDSSAFGDSALASAVTGSRNSAFGKNAVSAGAGNDNCGFGYNALSSSTGGVSNSAFGSESLESSQGSFNSAFGYRALKSLTSGSNSAAFGSNALALNTTGANNSAFGSAALFINTIGAINSAFGNSALSLNTEGSSNSAFGNRALVNNSIGDNNVAFGDLAGDSITTGSNNVLLGARTDANAASSNCIVIGYNQTVTGNNQLNIGGIITGDLSTGILSVQDTISALKGQFGASISRIALGTSVSTGEKGIDLTYNSTTNIGVHLIPSSSVLP